MRPLCKFVLGTCTISGRFPWSRKVTEVSMAINAPRTIIVDSMGGTGVGHFLLALVEQGVGQFDSFCYIDFMGNFYLEQGLNTILKNVSRKRVVIKEDVSSLGAINNIFDQDTFTYVRHDYLCAKNSRTIDKIKSIMTAMLFAGHSGSMEGPPPKLLVIDGLYVNSNEESELIAMLLTIKRELNITLVLRFFPSVPHIVDANAFVRISFDSNTAGVADIRIGMDTYHHVDMACCSVIP